MIRAAILLSVLALALALPKPEPVLNWDPRVVGGADAGEGEIPYQVSLRWASIPSFHFCGASIISEKWLLCAAHCTTGRTPSNTLAVVGSIKNSPIGKTHKIKTIINHPNYNANKIQNDVAVLEVVEEIEFSDLVQKIALASMAAGGDQLATLSGWGQISNPGSAPNNLQVIQLRTITNPECKELHTPSNAAVVYDGNICTFTQRGEGACMGDSGGPLVVNGVQEGIVSWGVACARGYPDVFTRVSYFRDWINENTGI